MRSFFLKPAELLVLTLLAEKPRHGYELTRLIQKLPLNSQLARSSVYSSLKELNRQGLIVERIVHGFHCASRKVYFLTPRAHTYLAAHNLQRFLEVKQSELVIRFEEYLESRDRLAELERLCFRLNHAIGTRSHKR